MGPPKCQRTHHCFLRLFKGHLQTTRVLRLLQGSPTRPEGTPTVYRHHHVQRKHTPNTTTPGISFYCTAPRKTRTRRACEAVASTRLGAPWGKTTRSPVIHIRIQSKWHWEEHGSVQPTTTRLRKGRRPAGIPAGSKGRRAGTAPRTRSPRSCSLKGAGGRQSRRSLQKRRVLVAAEKRDGFSRDRIQTSSTLGPTSQ